MYDLLIKIKMPQDAGHAFCRCAMTCAFLSLHSIFKAHNECQVIIIIIKSDFTTAKLYKSIAFSFQITIVSNLCFGCIFK